MMGVAEIPALDADAVLWSAEAAERAGRPLLVLLHGYGADERDLFGLAPYLPPEFVVAAVRAPLAPPWPAPGYSWYPIEGLESRDPDARDGCRVPPARVARRVRPDAAGRAARLLAGRRGRAPGHAAATRSGSRSP